MKIVELTKDNLPAFKAFAMEAWKRPCDDHFLNWRYFDCPSQVTLIALDENRCVASLSAFEREYQIFGKRTDCLVSHDWYVLPGERGILGVSLFQKLKNAKKPLITTDLTSEAAKILNKLGSGEYAHGEVYLLDYTQASEKVKFNKYGILLISLYRAMADVLKRGPKSKQGKIVFGSSGSAWLDRVYGQRSKYDIHAVPREDFLAWLNRGPSRMGWFIPLYFEFRDGSLGWCLVRIYSNQGVTELKFLEIYGPEAGSAQYGYMIEETISMFKGVGLGRVWAACMCEDVAMALSACGFEKKKQWPLHLWSAESVQSGNGGINIGWMFSDSAFLPLPVAD